MHGTTHLVSIVTPCLNPGHRLTRCLDSVTMQGYKDIEHIVVDGGSTDGSLEILREREVHHISEPDAGQTHAINKGFGLAKGSILTWLNADDELMPDAVAYAVQAFVNEGAELTYGDCEEWSLAGHKRLISPPQQLTRDSLRNGNVLAQPGTFFSARALAQVGPLDESFDLAMDFDIWLRLMEAGVRAIYIPRVLARFEIHSESKTGRKATAAFLVEESRAFLKCGRRAEAHIALARAVVSAGSPGRLRRRDLIEDVLRLRSQAPTLRLDRNYLIGSVLTEAVLVFPVLRSLIHLASIHVWTSAEMRHRALRGIRAVLASRRDALRAPRP